MDSQKEKKKVVTFETASFPILDFYNINIRLNNADLLNFYETINVIVKKNVRPKKKKFFIF